MKQFSLTALLLSCCYLSFSQNKYTLSGTMRDGKTGEVMIGAGVAVKELPGTGATTNAYGFYSLTLLEGKYTFSFKYTGYETKDTVVDLHQNVKMNFSISEKITSL